MHINKYDHTVKAPGSTAAYELFAPMLPPNDARLGCRWIMAASSATIETVVQGSGRL